MGSGVRVTEASREALASDTDEDRVGEMVTVLGLVNELLMLRDGPSCDAVGERVRDGD